MTAASHRPHRSSATPGRACWCGKAHRHPRHLNTAEDNARWHNLAGESVTRCWEDLRGEWSGTWPEVERVAFTCLLPDGHDGAHEWTPDDQIGVRFT